jgi:tetratricopeptide (TPR) repeat protein
MRGRRPQRSIVSLCLALGAFAAAPMDAASQTQEPAVSLHTSFDHYWRRYLSASSSGDGETAKRMLGEIQRLRVERNAFNLTDVGLCFVYQGFAYLEGGNLEEARNHFEIARSLAPDLPTAYWGLAKLAQREGILSFPRAIVYRIRAQFAALRSERDGPFAGWNLVYLLFCAYAVVFFAFALVMVFRYGVLLFHDLEERLGEGWSQRALLAATAAILALPLMLTAGFGWLAPHWVAVTFGYQSVKERAVSVLGLLLLLASAPFPDFYSNWVRTVGNPLYQASLSSLTGTFDVTDLDLLRRAAKDFPEDRDVQFLLATQYKNLGDYELAAQQYRRILETFPGDLDARLNLGNIYFAQLDWEGALVQYNQLIGENDRKAMAYYNKSLAHAENFQFAEREQARLRAEDLDAAAIAAYEKLTGEYRLVADARLDAVAILAKFRTMERAAPESSDNGDDESEASPEASGSSGFWSLRFIGAALLFGALIVALEATFKDRKLTQRCRKCGSAFCGRCQIGTGRKGLCTQCYHLFFMKDGVSAAARNEKLGEVQKASKSRALIFRVLSLVAPGAGHISEGMPLVGVGLLFLWILGALAIALGGALYSMPDGLLGLGTSVPILLLAVMAIVLLTANLVARPTMRG